jgi:threonine dehydrogenase-like Zn-dependent dehydrogenase
MGDVATIPAWYQRAIRWLQYKKVSAEPMISRTFRLGQAKQAFEAFGEGQSVKVLFEM